MHMVVFSIRVYDTDKDGEADTYVIYLTKKDGSLVEVQREALDEKQKQQVRDYLKEKETMKKFQEEEDKFNKGQ